MLTFCAVTTTFQYTSYL